MTYPETPVLQPLRVECRTEGCENYGQLLDVLVVADSPAVMCGPCSTWIIHPIEQETPA